MHTTHTPAVTGRLTVTMRYYGPPEARKDLRALGPWVAREVELFVRVDISYREANEMVHKLHEENPGLEFDADWNGPFNV